MSKLLKYIKVPNEGRCVLSSLIKGTKIKMAPSVRDFYAGKSILVTGATGFVGKVLVEKLLRSCTGIKTMYILMRPKKGVSSEDRLKELWNNKLYALLRETQPSAFDKMKLVSGDILLDDLGISSDDRRELQNNCNIVFHSAACVRFDQKLKDAINQNTLASQRVLKLAETITNLEAYVHLSTAYCHCSLPELAEQLYPTPHNHHRIIDIVDWMDDDMLQYLEPKLIVGEPNTYSYTKALSENLVAEYGSKFPIAIARLSIVIAALDEPIPGWIDNLNGPTGIIIASAKGVIRTMHCEPSYAADALPVDVVANGLILIAYATALDRELKTRVYNVTLSGALKNSWAQIIECGEKWVNDYPPTMALWYPGGSIKSYWLSHQICLVLFHLLPAYFIDLLLLLCGQKTFMVKLQHRITNGLKVLQSYTIKDWVFKNSNYCALRDRISDEENKIFKTDVSDVKIDQYLKNYVMGSREYCCRDPPSTLPRARKLHKIRYFVDKITKLILFGVLVWFLYSNTDVFTSYVRVLDSTLKRWSPINEAKAAAVQETIEL